MPRFFIDSSEIKNSIVRLSQKESHHAIRVLRLKVGDAVELLDGKGKRFTGVVTAVEDKRLIVLVDQNSTERSDPARPITLAISVIRPDRMEWLVEKASELGATRIAPLLTKRSIIRLSAERWARKTDRWRKIAKESCKQCGREIPPVIEPIQKFEDFITSLSSELTILIPTLTIKGIPLRQALDLNPAGHMLILIGPEGDFTIQEAALSVQKGAQAVSLGHAILRSETAAIYVLSVLQGYFCEN